MATKAKSQSTRKKSAPKADAPLDSAVFPSLDPATAAGITPVPAGPPNPGEQYDDSQRG